MQQLFFDFYQNHSKNFAANNFLVEDFIISDENRGAHKILQLFFTQKDFQKSHFRSLILSGQRCSGKTHLLNIFAQKFAINFIDHEQISKLNPWEIFYENGFFVIDDFLQNFSENQLLHLLNMAQESSSFVVLSDNWQNQIDLPDLKSRLKNIQIAEIKSPSCETLRQILVNLLSRKQIILGVAMVDLIMKNIPQSYLDVVVIAKKIDFFSNENGRKITINDIKKILKISA